MAIQAAESAAKEILAIYNSGDFQAELKGDNSPLTRADKKAHEVIVKLLTPSELPILSEEGKNIPYAERRDWEYFWMVDPLDGTKEFIKRNDEFTVNIALIHENKPMLGVVVVPVGGDIYYAVKGAGAYLRQNEIEERLAVRPPVDLNATGLRVVASRSHMNPQTEQYIGQLRDAVLVSAGSSLKFTLIAAGKADLYPRFGPTMEWDTAAPHIIINEVGRRILQHNSEAELLYNKENLLNPNFLVI